MKELASCILCAGVLLGSISGFASEAKKVLIIYYSHSGNTRAVAEKLQAKTGADLYRVETVRTYPSEYNALTKEAKRELEEEDLPALKTPLPDMSGYDLILVGGPVWWYTVPTPIMQFLKQADFSGKKAAAFCTHAGGIGQFFPHFREQAKSAHVLDGLSLWGTRVRDGETDLAIDDWLAKLK